MSRNGAHLALLMLGGFRSLVDAATVELARRGHADVRPVYEFAMRAIAAGAENASELGRRLSVTKQAAAKTLLVLQERGYVVSAPDPADARRNHLQVTPLGFEVMREGEAIFDDTVACLVEAAQLLDVECSSCVRSGPSRSGPSNSSSSKPNWPPWSARCPNALMRRAGWPSPTARASPRGRRVCRLAPCADLRRRGPLRQLPGAQRLQRHRLVGLAPVPDHRRQGLPPVR